MQKDLETYEELFDKIDEQKSAQDQLASLFSERAKTDVENDSQLLEELDSLEIGEIEA
jgi:hypothetical protein